MSRSSRSSSRARADKRRAVGDLGHRRGDRDVGLAVELAAHVLDRLLEAQPDLGFFDLEPADPLARLGELLLGRRLVRPADRRAWRPRPRAASDCSWRRRRRRSASCSASPARSASRAAIASIASRLCSSCGAPGPGPRFFVGPGGEPGFDLGQAGRRAPNAARRRPRSDLELLSEPRRMRRGLLDFGAARCQLSAAPASAVRASSSASTARADRAPRPPSRRPDPAAAQRSSSSIRRVEQRVALVERSGARRRRCAAARAARGSAASSSCRRRRSASVATQLGPARGGEPLALGLDRPRPRRRSRARRASACSTASASAAAVTADDPDGPARHGLGPPKRSPSRVTAIRLRVRQRDVERRGPARRRRARTARAAG